MSNDVQKVVLDHNNVVLRGMSLQNTEFIYGLVIFTGHQTKVMMNSAQAKYKKSRLEIFTDNSVKALFVIQLAFTLIVGIIAYFPYQTYSFVHPDGKCPTEAKAKCGADEACRIKAVAKCDPTAWYL